MKVRTYSKIGSYHKQREGRNEDYACNIETDRYAAILLADGVSACQRGAEGAKMACQAVEQIIVEEGEEFFDYKEDKMAYLLIQHILQYIGEHKQTEIDISEYGSTFLMVLLDQERDEVLCFNLGDGSIFSVAESGLQIHSKPKRFQGNPCVTITKNAEKYVDIQRKEVYYGEHFILGSDGFIDLLYNPKTGKQIEEYIRTENFEALNQLMEELDSFDDCTYQYIKRSRL